MLQGIAPPRGVFGVCDSDRPFGRFRSAQCSARILDHRADQKDAEVEDRASVIRRDEFKTIYALHSTGGAGVALATYRNMAIALARQNDMAPVFVH